MPPEEAAAAAATPSASPAAEASSSTTVSEPSFEGLGDSYDEVEISQEAASPVSPATEIPPADALKPADAKAAEAKEPPKAPEQKPAEAKPQEGKEPPKEPAAVAATEPPASSEPQGLVQQLAEHRSAIIDALAAERFALSKAEIELLDTDPVQAVPKLVARAYYEAVQSTLLHIQNFVPRIVTNVMQAQKAQQDAEEAFYGKFPAIDRGKHATDVNAFANLLRTSNPQISQEDLLAMVGAAVMAKHGLSMPVAANGNGAAAPKTQQQPPFVPARPGASVKVTPEEESPFAGLGKDWEG